MPCFDQSAPIGRMESQQKLVESAEGELGSRALCPNVFMVQVSKKGQISVPIKAQHFQTLQPASHKAAWLCSRPFAFTFGRKKGFTNQAALLYFRLHLGNYVQK